MRRNKNDNCFDRKKMKKKLPIFKILTPDLIQKIPLILTGMLIGAGFEVAGLSLVIPLFTRLTNPTENQGLDLFGVYNVSIDGEIAILYMLVFFALFFITKGIYLSFLTWMIGRLAFNIKANINKRLMRQYIWGFI